MSVTRRRFLQSVGAGGGAGALFATMGALGLAPAGQAAAPPFAAPRPSGFTLTGRAASRVVVLGAAVGSAEYDLLLRPAGRVYFAGDWRSHAVAWQHGAFVAARAAVTALHRRALAD